MITKNPKVILITGASAGIGRACALELAQQGHRVYGTSRTLRGVTDAFTMLPMDVNDAATVQAAVKTILDREGRIDVVVNNAGFGCTGAVEDTAIAEAQAIFETNFFGVMRVCHAVLPSMRAQRSGLIINISSIGGQIALPYRGLYSATKYALEGMSEAMRMEVKRFGLHVVLVEPGDVRTEFSVSRRKARGALENPAYREVYQRLVAQVEASDLTGAPPEAVARVVRRIVATPRPKVRYLVGPFIQQFAVLLKRLLPGGLFERLIMLTYDVT
ncbi:MAG TPA: SDR family NAD(P)-dependent oxidoreductase [Anaerolineae bacterium]|nr:SDR family NAD(P)-dependent oxidoreductase [Anaerolineae bacterium]